MPLPPSSPLAPFHLRLFCDCVQLACGDDTKLPGRAFRERVGWRYPRCHFGLWLWAAGRSFLRRVRGLLTLFHLFVHCVVSLLSSPESRASRKVALTKI